MQLLNLAHRLNALRLQPFHVLIDLLDPGHARRQRFQLAPMLLNCRAQNRVAINHFPIHFTFTHSSNLNPLSAPPHTPKPANPAAQPPPQPLTQPPPLTPIPKQLLAHWQKVCKTGFCAARGASQNGRYAAPGGPVR